MEWVPIVFITFKALVLFTGMFFAVKWHHDQDKKAKSDTGGPEKSTEMRLFATMLVALALSLVGIVYAGCWGNAADGGFGGALGCVFTLFVFLMSKPTAEAILLGAAKREKAYLGVASVMSMLAWKFGDIAAAWLKF